MTREESLKILRDTHDKALFSVRNALETLIPELKESEDEKIRKALIELVELVPDYMFGEIKPNKFISYLEKQKEQKSTNNVSKEEYVKIFKALCNAYEIKLPNREYDIYYLCDDLYRLTVDRRKNNKK